MQRFKVNESWYKMFLFSSVHDYIFFFSLTDVLKKNIRFTAVFHLVWVFCLHCHAFLFKLYLFLTKWYFIYFGTHKWDLNVNSTCRYFLLLCILSNYRKQNKRTETTNLSNRRTKWISYDPHTYSMLVVCHLCIFEYCIKGALIHSVRVCIIY